MVVSLEIGIMPICISQTSPLWFQTTHISIFAIASLFLVPNRPGANCDHKNLHGTTVLQVHNRLSNTTPPIKDAQFQNGNTSSTRHIDMLLRNTALYREDVKDAERKLEAYQAEIDKRTSLTEHEQDETKKKLLRCRSLLSPVHCLPPEILGDIFTILNDLPARERWLSSKSHPALAVSGTCGRWRDIAISTSSVWSSIAIRFGNTYHWINESYSGLHSLTRLFLERSQSCPLKLTLDFEGISDCNSNGWHYMVPTLKTLVRHSEQWRTIELVFIERGMIAHEVFSPIAGHLPLLIDLTLFGIGEDDNSDESEDFHIKLFSDSPALTSISYEPFLLTPRSLLALGTIKINRGHLQPSSLSGCSTVDEYRTIHIHVL
ncbi:hypothetical protein WG66_016713 [Moniliophthora roreri]|nr:hypothetical protein WG66_016713 [Moniliophthora roreri]